MVNAALSLGGIVGVFLSGAFMYWQVGKYAAPQVPRTLFDERKELIAYTAGLFIGIPLSLPLIFYLDAIGNAALLSAVIDLALVVVGTEVGQYFLLRTHYFRGDESGPFYALGARSGIAGLLSLAIVAQYLSGPSLSVLGVVVVFAQSVAILIIEVAGALLSVPAPARQGRLGGSPVAGGLFGVFGFFVLGLGVLIGPGGALFAAALAAAGGGYAFQRIREPVLGGLLPPRPPPEEGERTEPSPYRRSSR
jgi:hypothetical protein